MNNVLPFLNRLLYSFQDNVTLWNQCELTFPKNNVYINDIEINNVNDLYNSIFKSLNENKLLTKYALACCTECVLQEAYNSIQKQTNNIIGECMDNRKILFNIYTGHSNVNFLIKKSFVVILIIQHL